MHFTKIRMLQVVILLACKKSLGQIYSAVSDLEEVFETEEKLMRTVETFLDKAQERIHHIKRMLIAQRSIHLAAKKISSAIPSNPVNAFKFIRILVSFWTEIEEILTFEDVTLSVKSDIKEILGSLPFPRQEDLVGSALALLRIQEVYDLEPTDFVSGLESGIPGSIHMSGVDCYEIGLQAYQIGDFARARLWLKTSLELMAQEPGDESLTAVAYEILAYSSFMEGRSIEALKFIRKLLNLTPNHPGARHNFWVYTKNSSGTVNESKPSNANDIMAPEEYFKYKKTCQNVVEPSADMKSRLHCHYAKHNQFLRLAPLKMEFIYEDPIIVSFKEVLSDSEISHLKAIGKSRSASPNLCPCPMDTRQSEILKKYGNPANYSTDFIRSGVVNPISEFVFSDDIRLAKTGWLGENDGPLMRNILTKVEDMTSLSAETAETIQVLNYGIGGHYSVHEDYFRFDSGDNERLDTGNRIATVLFYLSEVRLGGSTVFPNLHLSLRPESGSALFWFNLLPDGQGNPLLRHGACPVISGSKWVATVWLHEHGQEFRRPCGLFQDKPISYETMVNGGTILSYLFFAFFVLQLNFSLVAATYITSILCSILTLGLAFSSRVRCVVLMLLPQLFSKRGRQALVAYAFILVFTGPAKNTMRNIRILSETMACTQGKLKAIVKDIVEMIKRPFYAIRDTIKQLSEKIKEVVNKVKGMINAIKRTVLVIIGVIKSAFSWLNSIVGMCSKKVGTPFQRCMKSFEGAIDDCKVQLGSWLSWMCSVAFVASHLCYTVKVFDYVCDLIDFVSDAIVDQAKRKLKEFMFQVRNIFYVKIEFSHSFSFSTEESKTIKEIAKGMMTEISQRTNALFSFFDIMSFGFSFFFLWMVLQILNYRRKFLTNDAFDNRYITDKIVQLDVRRTQLGRETILPLNVHEKKKYAPLSSFRLIKSERRVIAKGAVFLGLSTLKLSLQMAIDYSLYWILNMIRYHGQFQTYMDTPGTVEVQVDGEGMLSELYASVLNSFQPTNLKVDLDTGPCLPDPLPPNLNTYKQVATLMVIAWLICLLEPYGLRLRFIVMSYYNPGRAEVRAVWLYNNILRARGSFLKYARRQLRRKFAKGDEGVETVSCLDRLRARCPLLRKIWKGKDLKGCLLCGRIESKEVQLIKCATPNCTGLYCLDCYATLQNLCPICKSPIEYGDVSDISEEKDSSEESLTRARTDSETSEHLNLDEVLEDDRDSELSYSYQDEEREVTHEMTDLPSPYQDLEAQKPIDTASITDLPSTKGLRESEYSQTLATRTQSGLWSLGLPDTEEAGRRSSSGLRRRTFMSDYIESTAAGSEDVFSRHPADFTPTLVEKINQDLRRSRVSTISESHPRPRTHKTLSKYKKSSDEDESDDEYNKKHIQKRHTIQEMQGIRQKVTNKPILRKSHDETTKKQGMTVKIDPEKKKFTAEILPKRLSIQQEPSRTQPKLSAFSEHVVSDITRGFQPLIPVSHETLRHNRRSYQPINENPSILNLEDSHKTMTFKKTSILPLSYQKQKIQMKQNLAKDGPYSITSSRKTEENPQKHNEDFENPQQKFSTDVFSHQNVKSSIKIGSNQGIFTKCVGPSTSTNQKQHIVTQNVTKRSSTMSRHLEPPHIEFVKMKEITKPQKNKPSNMEKLQNWIQVGSHQSKRYEKFVPKRREKNLNLRFWTKNENIDESSSLSSS